MTITNGDFESNFEVLKKKIKKPLKVPSLARSVPKPLKVPSLARSVPKPLKVPSLARSVQKPLKSKKAVCTKVMSLKPSSCVDPLLSRREVTYLSSVRSLFQRIFL